MTLFEDYLYVTNSFEESSTITLLIEEIFRQGFDADSLIFFSQEYTKTQKQNLIQEIFKKFEHSDEAQKYQLQDVLKSFLIETNLLIQEELLPIFIKNLTNKKDFKLVFKTLEIFTSKWQYFNDSIKKKIYFVFLKILENPFDIFVEEGIFEITKIILDTKSSENRTINLFTEADIKNFLKKLGKTALKSKNGSLYAALESITQIVNHRPNLISRETYEILFPLFKKLIKKRVFSFSGKQIFIKISLSYINLMIMFEKDFSELDYINSLNKLIEKIVNRMDHAHVKYFLELLINILKNTHKLPTIKVIHPSFIILRDLLNKKDRLEQYVIDLIKEIIQIIWPQISDEDKDIFFQETEFGDSIL